MDLFDQRRPRLSRATDRLLRPHFVEVALQSAMQEAEHVELPEDVKEELADDLYSYRKCATSPTVIWPHDPLCETARRPAAAPHGYRECVLILVGRVGLGPRWSAQAQCHRTFARGIAHPGWQAYSTQPARLCAMHSQLVSKGPALPAQPRALVRSRRAGHFDANTVTAATQGLTNARGLPVRTR